MTKRKTEKQGSGDGLCGIYAIANYLKHDERFREPDELWPPFWYLLEAMQAEGLLQPHYIWSGMETYHLKAVFDRVCLRLGLAYNSYSIADALKKSNRRHFVDMSFQVFEENGAVIVGPEGHWLLMHGRSDRLLFVDDSSRQDRKQIKVVDGFELSNDGLLLLRRNSALAQALNG